MSEKFIRREVVTWETRLQHAYTAEDVLGIVKEFIATWSPAELATLPQHLRPGRLRDGDDVGLYAFKLVSREAAGPNALLYARMTTFFRAASQRLSQIASIARSEAARAKANEDTDS